MQSLFQTIDHIRLAHRLWSHLLDLVILECRHLVLSVTSHSWSLDITSLSILAFTLSHVLAPVLNAYVSSGKLLLVPMDVRILIAVKLPCHLLC